MQKFIFSLILTLLSLGAAAAEPGDSVRVTGNVLDSFTREYLDSVSVELLHPISGEVITQTMICDWIVKYTDEDQRRNMENMNPIVRRRMYTFMAVPGTYLLRLTRKGYQEKEQQITIPPKRYGRRTETWEVKDVLLDKDHTHHLDEAVVHATKIKMMTKGDTVVYNADAFQVADGSMLDGLIAMMPGLEIRDGGRIYQNGEYIPELRLNGKDFFNGDPAIALKNLPAYTVKDLRIYHRAPNGAYLRKELTNEDTLSWNKVLDVRLKKQYSHGWITNAEVAAGPAFAKGKSAQDVWLARLFGLHFSDHTRLGVFANVNNINDTGLASSDGHWSASWTPDPGVTTMQLGALDFTVDGKKTKLSYNLNMQGVRETTDSETETSATSFLPSGDVYRRSRSTNTHDRYHFVWNNTFNWNGKKATFFFKPGFDFFRRYNDGQSFAAQFSADPADSYRCAALDSIFSLNGNYLSPASQRFLINRTSSIYSSREDFWWEIVRLGTSFNSPLTGNYININLHQDYKHTANERRQLYDLRTYSATNGGGEQMSTTDFQNRYIDTPSQSFSTSLGITYHLHKIGNFKAILAYTYNKDFSKNNRDYYRLDRLDTPSAPRTGGADTPFIEGFSEAEVTIPPVLAGASVSSSRVRGDRGVDDLWALPSTTDWRTIAIDADNTYRAETNSDHHSLNPSLMYDTNRFSLNFVPSVGYKSESRSDTRAVQGKVSRSNVLFNPAMRLSYRYNSIDRKSKENEGEAGKQKQRGSLSLNYSFSQNTPSLSYLLDTRDASDPLHIYLGNPDLRNGYTHSVSVSQYFHGDVRFTSTSLSYTRRQRQVAQGRSYNTETGAYTYRPENVDGNWNASGSFSFGLTPKNSPFTFSSSSRLSYNNSVDLISPDGHSDAVRSEVHNTSASERLEVGYSHKNISTKVYGNASWNHATSERQNFTTRNTFDYVYGATFNANNFLWGLSFSTDLVLRQRRGYGDASMRSASRQGDACQSKNDNTLVWDAQLSRSFGKAKAWNVRLKGHDLLRQLSNVTRTLNAQGLTETWTNSLPSYLMLHVSYRWNKNPKKK